MFKKILFLLMMGTLPMFACGPMITTEMVLIGGTIMLFSSILVIYTMVCLFNSKYRPLFIVIVLGIVLTLILNPLVIFGLIPFMALLCVLYFAMNIIFKWYKNRR